MTSSTDLLLSIVGFGVSLYGGYANDLLFVTMGLLVLAVAITQILRTLEEDVKVLKAQINTQLELKKIWSEIAILKGLKMKKKGSAQFLTIVLLILIFLLLLIWLKQRGYI
ncbi:MAG: hypothetical protein ABIC95_00490 [archaeon]